jgi:hypothetical protein
MGQPLNHLLQNDLAKVSGRESVNTRGIEYMGMDLERGLSTKEWPYVYHMKAS